MMHSDASCGRPRLSYFAAIIFYCHQTVAQQNAETLALSLSPTAKFLLVHSRVNFALIIRIAATSTRLLVLPAGLSTSTCAVLLVPHFECCWHCQQRRLRRAEEVRGLAGAAAFGKVTAALCFGDVQKKLMLLSRTIFCFELCRTLFPYRIVAGTYRML